jgi:hypothetical protein
VWFFVGKNASVAKFFESARQFDIGVWKLLIIWAK